MTGLGFSDDERSILDAVSRLVEARVRPGVCQTMAQRKTAIPLGEAIRIEFDSAGLGGADPLGGQEDKGFAQLLESLEIGRIAIVASAVGLAANALSEAKRHAAERVSFGARIDQNQAIQMKLAEMATRLVTARPTTRCAARPKQSGHRCKRIAAMAKIHASDPALAIAHKAFTILGGAGYIQGCAVVRLHLEALQYSIGEGPNEINRLVIARSMRGTSEMAVLGLLP